VKPQIYSVNIEIEKLLKLPRNLTRLDTSCYLKWYAENEYLLRWTSISGDEHGTIVKTQNLREFIEVVQRVLDLRRKKPIAGTAQQLRKATA
jgi:hypothetical protein